jgi:general stress protein 26
MNNKEIKTQILAFMRAQRLAVISTIDVENNKPEAAVIAFSEKENLGLIFGTSAQSRKYKNLQTNQNVSFVIGWSDELGTIQYEGIAQELLGNDALEHGKMMAEKNESAAAFLTRDDQRYFLVRPTWIRFVDKSKSPDEKSEIVF